MTAEINLGNYEIDEDGSGNLVIKDSTGTTVLTHTDGGDWSYGANVDHNGNDVSNVGALDTEYVTLDGATASFDDIVSELNAGKVVYAGPGTYSTESTSYTVNAGQLIAHDDAVFDFSGQTFNSGPIIKWYGEADPNNNQTTIDANVSEGDTDISVTDASGFSAGDLALIRDDSTGFGNANMNRGEIVVVKSASAGTVNILEGAYLSHSTTDTITIEPIEPVTGGWRGGEVDLTGTDITSAAKFMQARWNRGFSVEDLTFTNDANSSIHHYFEFEGGYRSGIETVETGRVGDGDLGLLIQTGEVTKYAYARNCTVYHGEASEFENDGMGPSIWSQYVDVTAHDGRFVINSTAQEPEFVRCKVRDVDAGVAGFENEGFRPTFDRCEVWNGAGDGIQCKGVGERIIEPSIEDVSTAVFLGGNGDHPEQGSEEVVVTSPQINECAESLNGSVTAAPVRIAGGSLVSSAPKAASDIPRITIEGAYIEGAGVDGSGCAYVTLRDVEWNGAGASDSLYRDTGSAAKQQVVLEGVDGYDANGLSFIDNVDTFVVQNCRCPPNETAMSWLARFDSANGGTTTTQIEASDARNTTNGYYGAATHVTNLIYDEGSLDQNGDNPKMDPANLSGTTAPYDGYTRVDDGTNTGNKGILCVWDSTAAAWIPQDGSAEFA